MLKKSIILSFFAITVLFSITSAAISPFYKECQQRGYKARGEYCIFPDNSKCLIAEFNTGVCGQKFKTEDYCIKQGGRVWDKNKCCPGLQSYLPKGVGGQPTCQPIKSIESINDRVSPKTIESVSSVNSAETDFKEPTKFTEAAESQFQDIDYIYLFFGASIIIMAIGLWVYFLIKK